MNSGAVFCVAFAALMAAANARAEQNVLFEIALDIDHDGKLDRAALVSAGGTGSYSPAKDWFTVGADERVDLYIYLGGGDAPLDLSRKPSLLKTGILNAERNNMIYPLETSAKGSLLVKTAYSLFGNWSSETLTIVHRNGRFLVAGWTYGFERKSGEMGDCDINLLAGQAVASKGLNGKKRAVRGTFRPVKLGAWSERTYLKACGF